MISTFDFAPKGDTMGFAPKNGGLLVVIPAHTQRLLDFLSDAQSYPHQPSEVRLVQTHASWVFIAPPLVFKVKKPVKFDFLDFSTLELRHAGCERELALNRRLAEDIYLGVESVCEQEGRLQFGGEGNVIEWVVKMREMNPRFFLNHLLEENAVGISEMDRIANRLKRFYTAQPPLPPSEIETAKERILRSVFGNLDSACGFAGHSLSAQAFDAIRRYTGKFESGHRALLASRILEGRIRDCHGDLHLEHIHLTPDAVRIYDCIEFNTDFRHIDVACDIAFLAMDLDFNARPDLSNRIVDRFAVLLRDNGMKPLMDFYKCYRACVRGKGESLHSVADTVSAAEKAASLGLAQRYYRLALQYAVAGSTPRAFVFMGKVASGKSALAEAIAQETGWSVLSSDRIRKTLAGVPLYQRGSPTGRAGLYAAGMTAKVYATLSDQAVEFLHRRQNIILDATFSTRAHRDALRQLLDQKGFAATWIEATVSDVITQDRLRRRDQASGIVSDARLEDYVKLSASYEAPDELPADSKITIDTSTGCPETLRQLMQDLAGRCASLNVEPAPWLH